MTKTNQKDEINFPGLAKHLTYEMQTPLDFGPLVEKSWSRPDLMAVETYCNGNHTDKVVTSLSRHDFRCIDF